MDGISDLYPEFSLLVSYRTSFNTSNRNSLLITGAQDWYSPTGSYSIQSEDNVRDPNTVHSCFDTSNIESDTLLLLKNTGLQSDMISLQKQFYYVAGNENAFRRRHATVPKMLSNRLRIKELASSGVQEDLVINVTTECIDAGKKQLQQKVAG